MTLVQCWTNVENVGPTLYQCYTTVLCLLGCNICERRICATFMLNTTVLSNKTSYRASECDINNLYSWNAELTSFVHLLHLTTGFSAAHFNVVSCINNCQIIVMNVSFNILMTTFHKNTQTYLGLYHGRTATLPFFYKLRYIVGFWLVEMVISTNQKPAIYRNLYENTAVDHRSSF